MVSPLTQSKSISREEQQRFQHDFVAIKKKIIMGGENRLGSAKRLMELQEQSARELEKGRIRNQSQSKTVEGGATVN